MDDAISPGTPDPAAGVSFTAGRGTPAGAADAVAGRLGEHPVGGALLIVVHDPRPGDGPDPHGELRELLTARGIPRGAVGLTRDADGARELAAGCRAGTVAAVITATDRLAVALAAAEAWPPAAAAPAGGGNREIRRQPPGGGAGIPREAAEYGAEGPGFRPETGRRTDPRHMLDLASLRIDRIEPRHDTREWLDTLRARSAGTGVPDLAARIELVDPTERRTPPSDTPDWAKEDLAARIERVEHPDWDTLHGDIADWPGYDLAVAAGTGPADAEERAFPLAAADVFAAGPPEIDYVIVELPLDTLRRGQAADSLPQLLQGIERAATEKPAVPDGGQPRAGFSPSSVNRAPDPGDHGRRRPGASPGAVQGSFPEKNPLGGNRDRPGDQRPRWAGKPGRRGLPWGRRRPRAQ